MQSRLGHMLPEVVVLIKQSLIRLFTSACTTLHTPSHLSTAHKHLHSATTERVLQSRFGHMLPGVVVLIEGPIPAEAVHLSLHITANTGTAQSSSRATELAMGHQASH